jgi:hypothetical protein
VQIEPVVFLIAAASFVLTIAIFVLLVNRAKPETRIYWIIACSIGACLWLGLVKGPVAVGISLLIIFGTISTFAEGRRIGKKVARSLNIDSNLYFTSLEQVMPMYLNFLATMERQGAGVEEVKALTIPMLEQGLDTLEARFGKQPKIDDARIKITNHVSK